MFISYLSSRLFSYVASLLSKGEWCRTGHILHPASLLYSSIIVDSCLVHHIDDISLRSVSLAHQWLWALFSIDSFDQPLCLWIDSAFECLIDSSVCIHSPSVPRWRSLQYVSSNIKATVVSICSHVTHLLYYNNNHLEECLSWYHQVSHGCRTRDGRFKHRSFPLLFIGLPVLSTNWLSPVASY